MLSFSHPTLHEIRLLSRREGDALAHLAAYRQLTRVLLEALLFDGSDIGLNSRPVLAKRVLARLQQHGLVQASPRLVGGRAGGSSPVVYGLTRLGGKVAGQLLPDLPTWRPRTRGTFLTTHNLVTAEVALAFRRAARANSGHTLIDWEHDWQIARRLGSPSVIPDALLLYGTPTWGLTAFVEIDIGTEGTRFFAGKIARYLGFHRDGAWRAHLDGWPMVLTVAPSAARVVALKRTTERLIATLWDAPRIRTATAFGFASTSDVIGQRGPLAAIWQFADRPKTSLFPQDEAAAMSD